MVNILNNFINKYLHNINQFCLVLIVFKFLKFINQIISYCQNLVNIMCLMINEVVKLVNLSGK